MKNHQHNILVLLSTFNGEKYLHEQLESIFNQKNVHITLLIRDDGSSDETINIINKFNQQKNKILLYEGDNLGAKKSFLKLIQFSYNLKIKFDYYAFSDQDDVWHEDKLSRAASKLVSLNKNIPLIYIGQTQMVDSELNLINTPQLNMNCSFGESLVTYLATGCTEVFNYKLLEVLVSNTPSFFHMHDTWVYQVCLAVGGRVFFDSKSFILYRQHDNNVLGGQVSFITKWKNRALQFLVKRKNDRSKAAESLLIDFDLYLKEENRNLLLQIKNYRKSFKNKFTLFSNKELLTTNCNNNFRLKVAILLGLY